jgi:hypothetical protein
MYVWAQGAEGAVVTAYDQHVQINRQMPAAYRYGGDQWVPMPQITGVHVQPPHGFARGFLQILVGGEPPTTWAGAAQHPRCLYYDPPAEPYIRAVAGWIEARIRPVQTVPQVGIDTTGAIVGEPPPDEVEDPTPDCVVLAIASEPQGGARLELGDELNRMRDALEGSPHGREFKLETRPSARIDELVGDLLEHPPTILHFSGHGLVQGLILTSPDGKTHVLSNPEALGRLIRMPRVRGNLRALVLNVCLSVDQAKYLAQWAPTVIGTTDSVSDPAAIAFTHGFYQAVGNRLSVAECFDAGTAAASFVDEQQAQRYTIESAGDPAEVGFD